MYEHFLHNGSMVSFHKEQPFNYQIGALLDWYQSPLASILGRVYITRFGVCTLGDKSNRITLEKNDRFMIVDFRPFGREDPPKSTKELLQTLAVGSPDYLDFLNHLGTDLNKVKAVIGKTNPRMARFARQFLGFHSEDTTKPKFEIWATKDELLAEKSGVEKFRRNLERIFV